MAESRTEIHQLLRALDRVGRLAVGEADPDVLAARAVGVFRESLDLACVSYARLDGDAGEIVHVAHAASFPLALEPGYRMPRERGLMGRCVTTGQPVVVSDVRRDPDYVSIVPGVLTEVVLPVRVDGDLVGVLVLEGTETRSLDDRVPLLQIAADRLGVALANARLVRERAQANAAAAERSRDLAFLTQIARIAAEDADIAPMLQRLTDAIHIRFGWELVTLSLVRDARYQVLAASGDTRFSGVGTGAPVEVGVVGRVARTGRPVHVRDMRRGSDYVEVLPGSRAELAVPVRRGDEVVAVLNLESRDTDAFDGHLPLMLAIGDQIGGIVANARLLDEVRRSARHLEIMQGVAHAAMSGGDLRTLLQRVASTVAHSFELALVTVVTVDADEFVMEACAGRLELPAGSRWPITAGITARCWRSGEQQLVLDTAADPDYVADFDDIQAQFSAPIVADGRQLGVISMQAQDPDRFHPEAVAVLSTLADQIAGAVHMAWTNEQIAESNATLTDLFGRYVSPELAVQLLEDPDRYRVAGERRQGTVMFADIRGFTKISQRLEPERLLGLLNEYFSTVGEAIFAENGSINRYLGDGFMAVFGAPEPDPKHGSAAVRAARALLHAVDGLSARWEEVVGEPLRVVVAINSGELILGTIGDPRHMEWTVLGDVVNVAARLETEAKRLGVRILVTRDTLMQDDGTFQGEYLGQLELRGREGQVAVYAVR